MTSSLTILGGGGWFPAHGRYTACALVLAYLPALDRCPETTIWGRTPQTLC
jgi:hypothetical protein